MKYSYINKRYGVIQSHKKYRKETENIDKLSHQFHMHPSQYRLTRIFTVILQYLLRIRYAQNVKIGLIPPKKKKLENSFVRTKKLKKRTRRRLWLSFQDRYIFKHYYEEISNALGMWLVITFVIDIMIFAVKLDTKNTKRSLATW